MAWPKVECGESNTKLMAMATNKMSDAGSQTNILGDSEGCLSENKQEHTELEVLIYLTVHKMVEGLIW